MEEEDLIKNKGPEIKFPPKIGMVKNLTETARDVLIGLYESGEIIASESIEHQRLSSCVKCEHITDNMRCRQCGCFVQVKAQLRYGKCPIGLW